MALTESSAFKDGTIKEPDLDITNSGSDGQYLKKAGTQFTWSTVDTSIADDSIAEVKLDIHNAPSGTDKVLGYTSNGMEWTTAAAGATGGGTNKVFWENEKTIDYNYTITNNHNALTAGPVTVAATGNGDGSAVVVTVGDGETWTVI
tara:strand:- start:121 stop:561 length:441 start_codon:yes stop_codon:yes gene_type:complete